MDRLPLGRRLVLLALRAYQLTASAVVGRQCRYLPTCSDYASEAVTRHGVWRGGWMAGARLCRCHPFGAWGYDPVPLRCEPVPASRPWRHGVWRMPRDAAADGRDSSAGHGTAARPQERASSSAARP